MKFENLKDMVTDKEQWIKVGKKAGQLSKVIVVEGVKAVALKGTAKVVTTSFDEGFGGVKKLSFDEITGIKNDETPKKKWFSKKEDKVEELLEKEIVVEAPSVDEKINNDK